MGGWRGRRVDDPPLPTGPGVRAAPYFHPQSDVLDSPGVPAGFVFAEAHRVRLDLQTGVCVGSEELGGTRDGWGHQVQIEAVDEAMPESLFKRPSRFKRSRSPRPAPWWPPV